MNFFKINKILKCINNFCLKCVTLKYILMGSVLKEVKNGGAVWLSG